MTAIAIDFGTSNTVVCVPDPVSRQLQTLRFDTISRGFRIAERSVHVVPSLAFVKAPDHWLFGEQVRAQRLAFAQPDRYFQSFKRELATDFQPPPRELDGQSYTAEAIATAFLEEIWHQVLQQVNPSQVILTAPVGAFERYLDWFRQLGDHLNLPNLQIIDESTAAALGYAVRRPGALVLVVDFGGGTLDLSLVRTATTTGSRRAMQAEVVAKSDAYVGGIDIDIWIVDDYLNQMGMTRSDVGAIGWQTLLELAEKLKIRLSRDATATESWFDDESFQAHDLTLSRDRLTQILESRQLLEQIRQSLDELLTIALQKGISKAEIEMVLLVGGSCQIPAVQQLLVSYFGRQRVRLHKPFEAVAQGALFLTQLEQVNDYLRHSYAIRLWEPYTQSYSYYKLFNQGSAYPCRREEPLILQVATAGQEEIRLDIGELAEITQAEVTYDEQGRMSSTSLQRQDAYRSLDTQQAEICVAHLDPPGQLGVDRISVEFEVTDQRVLVATVRDLLTQTILVDHEAIAKLQ